MGGWGWARGAGTASPHVLLPILQGVADRGAHFFCSFSLCGCVHRDFLCLSQKAPSPSPKAVVPLRRTVVTHPEVLVLQFIVIVHVEPRPSAGH